MIHISHSPIHHLNLRYIFRYAFDLSGGYNLALYILNFFKTLFCELIFVETGSIHFSVFTSLKKVKYFKKL